MKQKDRPLQTWRDEIDKLDLELIAIVAERMEMVREIGKFKKTNKLPILNNKRHQTVIKKWQIQAEKHSLSKEFIENMYELIHEHAITIEADC